MKLTDLDDYEKLQNALIGSKTSLTRISINLKRESTESSALFGSPSPVQSPESYRSGFRNSCHPEIKGIGIPQINLYPAQA